MSKFTVLNVKNGYYNQNNTFSGYNLENAALYSDQDLIDYGINTMGEENIITEYTHEDLDKLPFDLPQVKTKEQTTESSKYVLMDKNLGYYDQEGQFSGFDMEYAGLYTDELADQYKINLASEDIIKTEVTEQQLNKLPFALHEAKPVRENNMTFDDLNSDVPYHSVDDAFNLNFDDIKNDDSLNL